MQAPQCPRAKSAWGNGIVVGFLHANTATMVSLLPLPRRSGHFRRCQHQALWDRATCDRAAGDCAAPRADCSRALTAIGASHATRKCAERALLLWPAVKQPQNAIYDSHRQATHSGFCGGQGPSFCALTQHTSQIVVASPRQAYLHHCLRTAIRQEPPLFPSPDRGPNGGKAGWTNVLRQRLILPTRSLVLILKNVKRDIHVGEIGW